MKGGNLTQSVDEDSPVQIFAKKATSRASEVLAFVLVGLSFFLAIFHLFSAFFGQADARLHRSTHLTVILILTFIHFPLGRKSWRSPLNLFFLIDLILIGLALTVQIYTSWDISKFLLREANQYDVIIGSICFVLVLEATRRSVGWIMTLIAGFFLFQTLYSDLLFGIFYGPPMSWRLTTDFLFMQAVGVYGVALMAMSSYIILFIVFGVLLIQSGAGNFFIDLSTALTGHRIGGAAKTAVVASAVMGTMSGSAAANVVSTGSFTIPLMKKI
ncbi:MAG: TRAP transporter large permease subunit, partial [Candidatus Hodarchaeota archaeon]